MNTQRATNKNVPTAYFFETDFILNGIMRIYKCTDIKIYIKYDCGNYIA